jgi:UDP-N-acetyl-D-mannosaminuronate dehydrogenase
MKVGFLGLGEIGTAVKQMYNFINCEKTIKELQWNHGIWDNLDVLNVCIPYSEKFVEIVVHEILETNCELTIIHSTVAVGTTRKIKEMIGDKYVVHSPVRGVHPNLYEGLLTFTKFVGSPDDIGDALAIKHMSKLPYTDIKFVESSETSELGKLVSTSYYGLCIAWHGEVQKMCEQFDVPFHEVMNAFNITYNEGYKKLGKEHVVRPTLTPPIDGIGGHCIIPNAELLDEQVDSPALKLIKDYKKK